MRMEAFDCDFHIHGRFSGGTSKDMSISLLAEQTPLKGLDIVATGDALHPGWLDHLKQELDYDGGLYKHPGSPTSFIIQCEVEDERRVHHVMLLPEISCAESLSERLAKSSNNIAVDGRPNVRLPPADIADLVHDVGGLMGPAHAFTPWTSMYKEHDSIAECYKGVVPDFVELGLSADSELADTIGELSHLTFMSNSDCHSPWPHRLGREFNRLGMKEPSFQEVVKAIRRKNGRGFTLNVGLNPLEGKYHRTACSRCYIKFDWSQAQDLRRRCPECGGLIKKGVDERISELADGASPPSHRPPYVRILPLAEVISLATGTRTLTSKRVKARWDSLIAAFGTEIEVLVDADIGALIKEDPEVGRVIDLFRRGRMKYVAGGGGKYGRPTLTGEKDLVWEGRQRTLDQF